MNPSDSNRGLRSALVLCLCALFFLLAMGITLMSSQGYRTTVASGDTNDTQRTALSYLVNQIRQADHIDGVGLGQLQGNCAVVLFSGDYETILYCYKGQLRELYTHPGSGLTAADGTEILALDGFEATLDGSLLTLTAIGPQGRYSTALSLHCGVKELGEVVV